MESLYVEAAKAITKLVASRPLEQAKAIWGLKKLLEKLKKEVDNVETFLLDVENHQRDIQLVNAWLKRVLDLAYLADDVMDVFSYEALHRRSSSSKRFSSAITRKKQCFSKFSPSIVFNFFNSNSIFLYLRMSRKVQYVLRSFDDLYKDAKKLGIRPLDLATRTVSVKYGDHQRNINHHNWDQVRELAGFEFVGRIHNLQELTKSLCSPNNDEVDLSTIAIVGMGGLGKTTLARRVYENEAVIEHFSERFWMYVSDSFSIKRILSQMLEKLTGSKCELSNVEDIIERVQQVLRGKRYLLVLDDVWNMNSNIWNSFKNSIRRLEGSSGSTILVTSRNKDVVRGAECGYMHQLTGLSDEESWAFFEQKAFPKGGISTYPPGFVEIGRRIVNKCKGLPLAISVLGGLLRTKEDILEWQSIENSKMWNLPKEENGILPSLLLSFNHLSSPFIKRCFAYCAISPKDAIIDRQDMINLWNAQGFLLDCQSEESNLTPEELGGKYFDILVNNSLLHAETRTSFGGEVTEYRMHDLVHDLALYVSKNDWLIWKGLDKMGNPSDGRHLVVFLDDDFVDLEFPLEEMKRLRTLYSHSMSNLLTRDLLMSARNLRVLKLVAIGLEEVPLEICSLSHLRYLDLSHNPIVTLPDSITRLYHLQTFRLIGRELKELPEKMYKLVNLRHIHLMDHPWCLPRGIERLTSLQTLPMLELHDSQGWKLETLGGLNDIKGLLYISGLEHVTSKEEAQKAKICSKGGISELQLIWGWGVVNNHLDVLDALQPHSNLKSLVITGYDGPNFPLWMMTMTASSKLSGTLRPLSNLVRVELLYCGKCQQLPTLGHLPCLRELSMFFMLSIVQIGQEFYHSTTQSVESGAVLFPALRTLNMFSLEELTKWEAVAEERGAIAFPLLESLRIESCDKLVQTPTNLFSLRHLQVDKSLKGHTLHNLISGINSSLISLKIVEVPELFGLPDKLMECRNLEELSINSCFNLQSLPDSSSSLVSLLDLSIVECMDLSEIPESIGACSSLKKLYISNCHNLQGIPDLSNLIHLEQVEISGCRKLRFLPRGLHTLPFLHSVSIGGLESLELDPSIISAESQLAFFPALKLLRIIKDDFAEEVPEWIGSISCLHKLEIKWCKILKHLPSRDAMTQLTSLVIRSCPLLQERCAKENGPEWNNISHIPYIRINSDTVQQPSPSTSLI